MLQRDVEFKTRISDNDRRRYLPLGLSLVVGVRLFPVSMLCESAGTSNALLGKTISSFLFLLTNSDCLLSDTTLSCATLKGDSTILVSESDSIGSSCCGVADG